MITVSLSCTDGAWSATVTDSAGPTITVVPLTVSGENLVGTSGSVSVSIVHPCPPTPVAPVVYTGTLDCTGCNYATFAFGDPELCTDDEGSGGPCANLAKVKVEWCKNACEWGGAGWYCVRAAGTTDLPIAVELVAGDECDETIDIVGGPYATQAEAQATCPTVGSTCAEALAGPPLELDTTYGPFTSNDDMPSAWFHWHISGLHRVLVTLSAESYTAFVGLCIDDCIDCGGLPGSATAGTTTCFDFSVSADAVLRVTPSSGGTEIVYYIRVESGSCP